MKPQTNQCLGHRKFTSTGTADIQTVGDLPKGTSLVLVSVETNPGRFTLDGTDPSLGVGPIMPNGTPPWLLTVGQGVQIKWVSTVAGSAVLQLTYLQ